MDIQQKFNDNLNSILKEKPLKLAVAVSGGADSMALTLLLHNWAMLNKVDMVALTVDHNLRKESAKEALKVNKWLLKYGIKHNILTYTGVVPKSNIEAIARKYRYDLLFNYLKENNIKYLMIAHNQDEQKETFFLNLSRGSGIYGLCAMPNISERNGIFLVRPLLNFTKADLKNYLKSIHQKWVEDPSNKDTKYKRVRIRNLNKLTQKLELTNERLINTMKNLERVKEALDFFEDKCYAESVISYDEKVKIDRQKLLSYPEEIALKTLSNIIKNFSGAEYPPRFESIELLFGKIKNSTLNAGITLAKCKIYFDKNFNIIIEKEIGRKNQKNC